MTKNELNMDYLKGTKIVEDLRECEEYLRESCNAKHEKDICEAMADLDVCRVFLEVKLYGHTYIIGSLCPKTYYPEPVSSYEDAVERIALVFNRLKAKDENKNYTFPAAKLENITALLGKNLLCL